MKKNESDIGSRMNDFEIEVLGESSNTERTPNEMMLERVREILSKNSPPSR
jgi:hypothetical protein